MGQQKYIAVVGNIGSGKSTLVQFLASQYHIQPFFEPHEENPYLDKFYHDMKAWAFHSQMFFLSERFRIHQSIETMTGTVVLDRTIHEDAEIFATTLFQRKQMTPEDFSTYWNLYQAMCQALRPPDLVFYLKCSLPTLQRRIKLRGRSAETNIPPSYLKGLQALYDNWIANYRQSEIITIDTGKLDYIRDLVCRIDVMKRIEKFL